MNDKKIWLSSPHLEGNEKKYIEEAFQSNWITSKGLNLDGFENDLENYLGQNCFVGALSSGTAAIHLALILLGVQAGDEVLCQSMTFVASANPILYIGATPIFIDSEPDTWNICPIALEQAIVDCAAKGRKPKVIIAVHLYGNPYKVQKIREIADKYEIFILEDAAEAIGSSFKGQKCGTFGDIGVLSFNGNKIITASSGGAVVASSIEVKQKALFYATQSKETASHYEHREIGFNYRMSNICAAIGQGQMEVLEKHIFLRRKMHAFYVDLFKDICGITVYSVENEDYFSNYWLSSIIIEPELTNGIDREMVRLAFELENIESRPLWKPMHLQPLFQKFPYYGGQVSENLFKKGLCLPSGSNLTDEDRVRISKVILTLFQNN